ncbi:MAG: hypothetical protein VX727_05880 [Planctomycetota bacterium]|nr:hypothetical protein [Planctomycetota bacterium]
MMTTRRPSRSDRGIALLLVLVTMATATTLAIGWLASQDNAGLVGRNVVATAEARCVASSGLDLAISVMQTESDWRTLHQNGVLFDEMPLGNGTIDLVLTDPTTNEPPVADSMEVHVIATATVGSISQSVAAYVSLLQDSEDVGVDTDVSAFALFSLSTIELNDRATVSRWGDAPASVLGRRLAMGTASGRSRSVSIDDDAAAIDATVYHSVSQSPALLVNSTGFDVEAIELPWTLSLDGQEEALPPAATSRSAAARRSMGRSSSADSVRIGSGETLHVRESEPLRIAGDLHLTRNARIVVHGSARIEVGGRLLMDGASIELRPNATLHMVIERGAIIDDASIGGGKRWISPDRIMLSGGTGDTSHPWLIRGTSSITGCIQGRTVDLVLEDEAVVKGRIAANRISLNDSTCVLYDHGLDEGLSLPRAGTLLRDAETTRHRRQRVDRLPFAFVEQLLELGRQRSHESRRSQRRSTRQQRRWARHWNSQPTPRPIPLECRMLTHGFDAGGFEAMVSAQETTP